jgi:hypothetical protein
MRKTIDEVQDEMSRLNSDILWQRWHLVKRITSPSAEQHGAKNAEGILQSAGVLLGLERELQTLAAERRDLYVDAKP